MLRCVDGTFYCGQTNDLKRRVREHNFDRNRSAKYLRGRTPARLVYWEKYPGQSEALRREAQVKRWPRAKKAALFQSSSVR